MEVQMKQICDGTKNKREVVNQSLDQYRAVFMRTVQQMSVIKAVSVLFQLNVVYPS